MVNRRFFISVLVCCCVLCGLFCSCKQDGRNLQRVIVSTDIGGSDPDDNQSMIHLLMYTDCFDLEGIISSPSYGNGSKEEILRMIDLYEKDYAELRKHAELMSPDELRAICKQGRHGLASWKGYSQATEGSDWIIKQAKKKDNRPLWVLVWGTLDDLAQALHDAPEIAPKLRVYYIGGPNKKWGSNSHHYIAANFPDLWMIENNASSRGFISKNNVNDRYNANYYDEAIRDHGVMGEDFINYYKGIVKMGDTPSLIYLMNGDPENPEAESWGGRFEPVKHTARRLLLHPVSLNDTIPVYSIVEFYFDGPVLDIPEDSVCFSALVDKQRWDGYQVEAGKYAFRYSPKAPATLDYVLSSEIPELDGLSGEFVVGDLWPGDPSSTDYTHNGNWFTDVSDTLEFDGKWQGAQTVLRHRNEVLDDWAKRWNWL